MAVSSSSEAVGLRLDGLGTEEAAAAVVRWLQEKGLGSAQTNYKLRDWLFARQRYWGEPFPIVFEEGSDVSTLTPSLPFHQPCNSIPHMAVLHSSKTATPELTLQGLLNADVRPKIHCVSYALSSD